MKQAILIFVLFLITSAFAVPNTSNLQGKLYDAADTPYDGSYSVTFSIYTSETGGALLWTETQTVTFYSGLFNVQLGEVSPLSETLFDGAVKWVQMSIGSVDFDRQPLTSVPYAIRAATVDDPDDGDWTVMYSDMVAAVTGNVGIGTSAPASANRLEVHGNGTTTEKAVVGISSTGPQGWLGTALYGCYGNFDEYNYGYLGASGYGLYARGATHAGYFDGDVDVVGNLNLTNDMNVSGTSGLVVAGVRGNEQALMADADGYLYWGSPSGSADEDWAWLSGSGISGNISHIGNAVIGSTNDFTLGHLMVSKVNVDAVMTLQVHDGSGGFPTDDAADPYIRFLIGDNTFHPGEYEWSIGVDNSETDYLKFSRAMSAAPGTGDVMTLTGAGNLTANGRGTFAGVTTSNDLILDESEVTGVSYLNGSTTVGTTGYGIRDNAGTMEYKNLGGSWTEIGSGSGSGGWEYFSGSGLTGEIYREGNVALGYDDPEGHLLNAEILGMGVGGYLDHSAVRGAIVSGTTVYAEAQLGRFNTLTTDGYPLLTDYVGVLSVIPDSDGASSNSASVYAWNDYDSGTNYAVYANASGLGSTNNYGIYSVATGATNNYAGYFEGNVRITGRIFDSSGDQGASGQILTSTGSGTNWIDLSGTTDSDWTITGTNMFSNVSGNVGVGTASPTAKLHVAGGIRVTGNIYDSSNDAGSAGQVLTATGSGTNWVNSAVWTDAGTYISPSTASSFHIEDDGDLDMGGRNIERVDELSANSIDPVLKINGKLYRTWTTDMVGQRTEVVGTGKLDDNGFFEIDLSAQPEASDLWLFFNSIDPKTIVPLVTPHYSNALYARIDGTKLIVGSTMQQGGTTFSYRLSGVRYDFRDMTPEKTNIRTKVTDIYIDIDSGEMYGK